MSANLYIYVELKVFNLIRKLFISKAIVKRRQTTFKIIDYLIKLLFFFFFFIAIFNTLEDARNLFCKISFVDFCVSTTTTTATTTAIIISVLWFILLFCLFLQKILNYYLIHENFRPNLSIKIKQSILKTSWKTSWKLSTWRKIYIVNELTVNDDMEKYKFLY